MKRDANPMQSAHAAPRCRARSKRTGLPCGAPAVRGQAVCRMHGAGGGHGLGRANPSWRHGLRSRDEAALRQGVAHLLARAAKLMDELP